MPCPAKAGQSFLLSRRTFHLPAALGETHLERHAHSAVVIHHQHTARQIRLQAWRCGRHWPPNGNRRTNVVPPPGELVTPIEPPCCSTIFFATASPRPGPPARVVNPASNTLLRISSRIPGPLSAN